MQRAQGTGEIAVAKVTSVKAGTVNVASNLRHQAMRRVNGRQNVDVQRRVVSSWQGQPVTQWTEAGRLHREAEAVHGADEHDDALLRTVSTA